MIFIISLKTHFWLIIITILAVFIGIYFYTDSVASNKESKDYSSEQDTSDIESEQGSPDIEPSPEQIEASKEENNIPTVRYYDLINSVFVKYEDRFGTLENIEALDDENFDVNTSGAHFHVHLSVDEGYAYFTNIDTSNEYQYPLN